MKMWEIREGRESDYGRRYGMRSVEDKAYECGYEDGYEAAMKEVKSSYGSRSGRY